MSLNVPDEYDDDAYRAGYAAAMRQIGTMALHGAGEIDPNESDDESDPETCPECGGPVYNSMGADKDVTPAGRVCPECEL